MTQGCYKRHYVWMSTYVFVFNGHHVFVQSQVCFMLGFCFRHNTYYIQYFTSFSRVVKTNLSVCEYILLPNWSYENCTLTFQSRRFSKLCGSFSFHLYSYDLVCLISVKQLRVYYEILFIHFTSIYYPAYIAFCINSNI